MPSSASAMRASSGCTRIGTASAATPRAGSGCPRTAAPTSSRSPSGSDGKGGGLVLLCQTCPASLYAGHGREADKAAEDGRHGPVRYWIVDDTSFPKQGAHSVGVAQTG